MTATKGDKTFRHIGCVQLSASTSKGFENVEFF